MSLHAYASLLAGGLALAGLLVGGTGPSQAADHVTSTVHTWDPAARTLVLGDRTQFQSIPADIALPRNIPAGQVVTITYLGSEDGVSKILSVRLQP